MEARCCPGKMSREQEQIRFILRWKGGEDTFTELCRQFSISRKTGYKRVERFKLWGLGGLGDRSRAPPEPVIERLIRAKGEHPTWGPKKPWLGRVEPWMNWPASSTAGQILDRAGLVGRRKRRRHTAPWSEPFAAAERPNDVWSIDFKGWFRTEDGVRIDPLTIQDGFSRCLLVCQGLKRPRGSDVRAVCERAFREYGLPRVMRSDNGVPFASVAVSSLSVWWIKLGILPERIEPAHPEQNGRLERLPALSRLRLQLHPEVAYALSRERSTSSIMSTDHTRLWDNAHRHCSTHRRCVLIRRR